jgi:FAD:protein FMN transferase
MRARTWLPLITVLLIAISVIRRGPLEAMKPEGVVSYTGKTMGSTFSVSWRERAPHVELRAGIDAVLARINELMSTYDPNSELSRFNRSRDSEWFPVARETAELINLAREISVLSDGAFDVTIKPLVAAWGFGPGPRGAPPTTEQLNELVDRIGYTKLLVRAEPPALKKTHPELEVDLNAIAPGYAADLIAALLQRANVLDYLIDIGGEIRIAGHKAEGVNWRVAIEQPDTPDRAAVGIYEPGTTSLATSGDYRKYYELNGRRISHTINPHTRRPIEHNLASVTVLSATCARADGLATALNVLGPDAGLEIARRADLSVLMLVRKPDGSFERRVTGWFVDARPAH